MNHLFKWSIAALAVLGLAACDAGTTGSESASTKHSQAESSHSSSKEVVMYKSPNCECCTGWADHLRKEGFSVAVEKRENMDAIKTKFGVSEKLASCHTAIVDGYVIEGHVPAADVERLLKERPDIVGLTAPGMPMKSPGMQKVGQEPQGYSVLAFDKAGKVTVFHKY